MPGWGNISCHSDTECQLCGPQEFCGCGAPGTVGKNASCLDGYCQTGVAGGVLCNNTTPLAPKTGTTGGVQLLLNVETGVAGFVAVEVQRDHMAVVRATN